MKKNLFILGIILAAATYSVQAIIGEDPEEYARPMGYGHASGGAAYGPGPAHHQYASGAAPYGHHQYASGGAAYGQAHHYASGGNAYGQAHHYASGGNAYGQAHQYASGGAAYGQAHQYASGGNAY